MNELQCRGMELNLFSVSGWELTWFLCGGLEVLGFSVAIEVELVFVSGN